MTRRFAGLIDRHPRRLLLSALAFFLLAGALGAGVGQRLDPFGADDPASESVIADKRLERAGFRETGVIVLMDHTEVRTRTGRERVQSITRHIARDPEVASVASALNTTVRPAVVSVRRSAAMPGPLRAISSR